MKKGLLLSIVASTMIFAGGDIAPVEPAAAAPAADCSDFYGNIGLHYITLGLKANGTTAQDLFDVHGIGAHVTLGVEKAIANGIGFGAELSGWSGLGAGTTGDWVSRFGNEGDAKLTQFYLTASFGNTAIKAGRYALPKKLSPFVWTDTTMGMKDMTFEGVLVANTDLADTTIYGTYLHSHIENDARTYFNAQAKNDELGAFALGFVNSSIANTTLSAVGYYLPNAAFIAGDAKASYAGFVTADTTFGDYKASARVGIAGGDKAIAADSTFGLSAMISGPAGMFNWDLRATYVNDGDFAIGVQNPFYTGVKQLGSTAVYAVEGNVYADIGPGKLNARLKYTDWDTSGVAHTLDTSVHARLGYSMKVFGDVSAKVEYRYTKIDFLDNTDAEVNEIRVDATYKF